MRKKFEPLVMPAKCSRVALSALDLKALLITRHSSSMSSFLILLSFRTSSRAGWFDRESATTDGSCLDSSSSFL